jgi:hypothetical protein
MALPPLLSNSPPMTIPFLLGRNMQLRHLTDSHLRRPNAHSGFELVKAARACSGSMQNAPAHCNGVNSEEAVRRCDDPLAQHPRAGLDPAIHLAWRSMDAGVVMLCLGTPRENFEKMHQNV